jgi:hypothetical protein
MAQLWTETDWLGNAMSPLADAISTGPKLGIALANARSEIALRQAQREKFIQDRQFAAEQNTRQGTDADSFAAVQNLKPNPFATAWPTPTPGMPYEQPIPITGKEDLEKQRVFETQRQYDINRYRNAIHDPAHIENIIKGGQAALGSATVNQPGGVTPQNRDQVYTQLKMEPPTAPTTHNYNVYDPTGAQVGRGLSADFQTDVRGNPITVPPGGSIMKTGDAPADKGPLESDATKLTALNTFATKLGTDPTASLAPKDAYIAATILADKYPTSQKIEKDDRGNLRPVGFQEKMLPPLYQPLASHINSVLYGQPPAVQAAPPAPVQLSGPPAAPAANENPPPIVPPQGTPGGQPSFMQTGTTAGEPIVPGSGHEMRREIITSQIYQQYLNSVTSYDKIEQAFQNDNLAADLNGIYALAKIFDPGSAVREGELHMAANTGAIGERLVGMFQSVSQGRGRLTPEMRRDIQLEGWKAANAQYNTMKQVADAYTGIAQRQGFRPEDVIPPVVPPREFNPDKVNVQGHAPTTSIDPRMQRRDQQFGVGGR